MRVDGIDPDRLGGTMSKSRKKRESRHEAFVLDCSVALAWCFPDEKADYPQSVLEALIGTPAIVPGLWPLEVANCLLVGERRKRCTQSDTTTWLSFLRSLPISIDPETSNRAFSDGMNLARSHRLSAYDGAYLELALRLGAPLATLDDKLRSAMTAVGISLFKP